MSETALASATSIRTRTKEAKRRDKRSSTAPAAAPSWARRGARATRDGKWIYDAAAADRAVRWIESHCVHTIGDWAGKPFLLARWQRRIVRKLFGWLRPDGTRKHRTVFLGVPRKNGKTTFAAALALALTIADGEPAAFVYSIAGNEEQARLAFAEAKRMCAWSPALAASVETLADAIYYGPTQSSFRPLASSPKNLHGLNPHAVIGDEVHAWKSREQYDVMRTALGARRQPVEIYITTAGHDRMSVCWQMWQRAERAVAGEVDAPELLAKIFAAGKDDDWTDERVWAKANPGLGVNVSLEFLRDEARLAKDSPALENAFRQLYLNQWTEQAVRLIPVAKWRDCAEPFDPELLSGAKAIAGLDLALVADLSALCLWFPPPNPVSATKLVALWRYWAPEADIRKRAQRDRVPYDDWARAGWISATPGDATDLQAVRRDIAALAEKYELAMIGADPMYAHDMVQQLAAEGVRCEMVRQGMLTLAQPTAEFVRRIIKGEIVHLGDPVTEWMVGNVAPFKDAAGNFKPDKKRSTERIDGVSAAVTGLALVLDAEKQTAPSVYETRGLRMV